MNIMDKALLLVSLKNRPPAETGELVSSPIFKKDSETMTPEEGKGEKEVTKYSWSLGTVSGC